MKLFAVSVIDLDADMETHWQLEHIFSTEEAAELYIKSHVEHFGACRMHYQVEEYILCTGVKISKYGSIIPF